MTHDPNGPIPSDKFDHAALERARAIGFPTLNPHIPALLEWLQDPNWPIFQDVADLLSDAGPALLPHMRKVLASDDAEWIAALLQHFCPHLPQDLAARLAPDIRGLASRPDLDHRPEIARLAKALTTP